MGKINNTRNYPLKTPEPNDKLIGSSAVTGETHNFLLKEISSFNSLYVSVLTFGAKGDGINDDYEVIQLCADFCSDNNKIMYVPWTGSTYIITRPIVPKRTGLSVFVDAHIKNANPAIGISTVRGCVFMAGYLTHPQQSKIEGLNDGEYLHRLSNGVQLGDKELVIDLQLYNLLNVDEIVLVRSDLLSVDRTGQATPTAGERRYGVYDFSVLNKIVDKKIGRNGEYIIVFEHPFEETIYEPRLLRFPSGEDAIYLDDDLPNPRMSVGPCENFKLIGTKRSLLETSGNQGFIQATCLYNFHIEGINLINSVGAFICNALCYGTIKNIGGYVKGPVLAIAFSSTDVRCVNIRASVNGPADETNQLVRLYETDNTNPSEPIVTTLSLFNKGKGAINSDGTIDYAYDAVWYATNNKYNVLIYRKAENDWAFYKHTSALWENDLPISLPSAYILLTGWGDSYYIPSGEYVIGDITYTIQGVVKENRSTINIHEGARNITLEDCSISTAENYDYGDTDINLVGHNIKVVNSSVYSNRLLTSINSETGKLNLDSNSILIGNSINKGDIPFSVNDITVNNVTTSGKPVIAAIDVSYCPLYSSEHTTSIVLQGSLAGTLTKLNYKYLLSGDTIGDGVIRRVLDSNESYLDRYYAYHSVLQKLLVVFSFDGFAGKDKGWYVIPATSVTEPASEGDTLTGPDWANLNQVYDKDDGFSLTNFGSGNDIIYLGEDCGYVIYGPYGEFANASGDAFTFLPNNPHRTFRGLTFDNIKVKRSVGRGIYVQGGIRNVYKNISIDRFIPSNINESNVQSTRYLVDAETSNSYYVAYNTFDTISTEDDTFSPAYENETIRNHGYGNVFVNILDDASVLWSELNRRYFRQNDLGYLRSVLDFSTTQGTNFTFKNGRILENTTEELDSLVFNASYFRIGYTLDIKLNGIVKGTPTFNMKGGDPASLSTLISENLPIDDDFEIIVNMEFLDRRPYDGVAVATNHIWASVSYEINSNSATTIKNFDMLQLNAITGNKLLSFEFVCGSGEQVDVFSYIITAKTNTKQ